MAKNASSNRTARPSGPPTNPKTEAARQRVWAAQDALSTLRRAEELKKNPQVLRDAQALAKREVAALQKVAGGAKRGGGK